MPTLKTLLKGLAALALIVAAGSLLTRPALADYCSIPAEQKKIIVMGDWLPWSIQMPIMAAQHKGYYADEGLDVELISPASSADPIKLVARERVQFSMTYVPEILMSRDQGIPVVAVAITERPYAQGLMVMGDSGIKSPADLKGKNIGVGPHLAAQAGVKTLLASAGLTFDDVKIIDPGWAGHTLLLEGKLDAVHDLDTSGPYILKKQLDAQGRPPVGFMLYRDYGTPNFYYQLFAASENWIKENPASTCRFLRATKKGYEEWARDPDTYNAQAAKLNEVFTLEQHAIHTDLAVAEFVDSQNRLWIQEPKVWESAQRWAKEMGLITLDLDVSEFFTTEYLPDELEVDMSREVKKKWGIR